MLEKCAISKITQKSHHRTAQSGPLWRLVTRWHTQAKHRLKSDGPVLAALKSQNSLSKSSNIMWPSIHFSLFIHYSSCLMDMWKCWLYNICCKYSFYLNSIFLSNSLRTSKYDWMICNIDKTVQNVHTVFSRLCHKILKKYCRHNFKLQLSFRLSFLTLF